MSIGEFCNREVVIADPHTSAAEAAALMRKHHVGNVVVVDRMDGLRKPVGIVTDRDIVVEVVANGLRPETVSVGDIMVDKLAFVREGDGVFDTIESMRRQGVRRVPVVDGQGELVGIVALDDAIRLLAEEINEVAKTIGRELAIEVETRK